MSKILNIYGLIKRCLSNCHLKKIICGLINTNINIRYYCHDTALNLEHLLKCLPFHRFTQYIADWNLKFKPISFHNIAEDNKILHKNA